MQQGLQLEQKLWTEWCVRLGRREISKYERSARKALSHRGKVVGLPEMVRALKKNAVTVFGDDCLVPGEQEQILDLCKYVRAESSVRLITDQRRISEASASPLLRHARRKKWRVTVCGEESSLGRMDHEILRITMSAHSKKEKALVWTGALRLSPPNLPKLFSQNDLDASYFLLDAAQTRWCSDRIRGWVAVHPGMFAFVGRSPLLSLEYFRAWSAKSPPLLLPEDVESDFRMSLRRVCEKTGQKLPPLPRDVFSPFDLGVFHYLTDVSKDSRARRFLRERLRRGESAVLPGEKIVLLSTLDRTDVAEEAAHYARLWDVPARRFGTYRVVLEEALAFMASTWVCPERVASKQNLKKMSAWESVHGLGYRLGVRLAKRWNDSRKDRKLLRTIWNRAPGTERDARVLLGLLRTIA